VEGRRYIFLCVKHTNYLFSKPRTSYSTIKTPIQHKVQIKCLAFFGGEKRMSWGAAEDLGTQRLGRRLVQKALGK